MLVLVLLTVPGVYGSAASECPALRNKSLDKLFAEVRRVTGGDEITLDMMNRFDHHLPRRGGDFVVI